MMTLKSEINRQTLKEIRSAIFVLCLDDAAPATHTSTLELAIHGGGANASSSNRWFDKMQLIIGRNGKVRSWAFSDCKGAILFEHSPLDAVVGIK